jgi:hypothetical protein
MTIGPAPMIKIDSMSVRFGMARPCALWAAGRQPARRGNDGWTPCPAGTGGRPAEMGGGTDRPRPRAVPPRRVRWTKPRRGAGWGSGRALSSGPAESEGSTPCPAVSVRRAPDNSPRRRRGAEGARRAAAIVLAGDVQALPAARFDRFGGSTPCPAVAAVGAAPCGRPSAVGRPHGVAPTVPLRKFGGRSPCPAVRRGFSAATSASMRRQ